MSEIVFNSKLIDSGYLYCPKEYSINNAKYKVIVSIPENIDIPSDIEMSAISDNSSDYLTESEIKYYLKLDEILCCEF